MTSLPSHARAVIIGGGIVGCSTAYHLGKLGWKDVVVLEKHKLTSGSTFHAAGLVGQLRSNANITQLLKYSVELYDTLEEETGLATGWKMNGGLRLACNKERMIEIERQATTAQSFGLEMQMLSAKQAQDLWPLMDVSDVMGAAFLPTDGQANPSDITQALSKGARMNDVKFIEDCTVTAINVNDGRVGGVTTNLGDIACDVVVNCGGQWARELGQMAGVNVPLCSVEHQYMITEPFEGVPKNLPTLRDPDRLTYFKEEVGGLVMGGYEPNPIPWAEDGIPEGFNFSLLDSDWDHFEQLMEHALFRVPALEHAGVRSLTNGPESFTPDGNFILGEAPEVANFFVGAGFNAFGIAAGGGAGKALAEWIDGGEPSLDLWPVDIRRFGVHHRDADWVRTRTLELYGKHYTIGWPFEEHKSARPVRTSALYERLKESGGCFGEKMGWERPNWFAPEGARAEDVYSFGRQNWFDHVGAEHQATRERVTVFDQSSFAKFMVSGPDAEAALNWICANDVSKAPGALTYTQMLNSRGGIECDLTVARLAEDQFYIVTGTGYRTHDFDWIKRNIKDDMDVTLEDITDHHCTLSLMGPKARDVLAQVTDSDVSNDAFAFGTCQEVIIAGATVKALRVTYVGELGWELHFPIEHALTLYDALMKAGESFGIGNAGYRAIESLRLEKGYRAWASDIGPDYSPLEAGMGWAVKMKSNMPFMGREAIAEQQERGLSKRLACFVVDDPSIVLLGRETIYRNGERVGWLSSGGWGYTVGENIGYGYVRNPDGVSMDYLKSGSYELDIATSRVPCRIQFGALVDAKMEKIKC
ncbi:MAG: GcvT family protein [Rhodospirillaceae bacterium]|jgi:sarcosine dehydrogenase|nr:GcvT family protein [Rhodospirillaceae bacterium]MBT5244706.1 GcvT family protein [Rhodospirillaceae bacterium]MBT5562447.1 GcvT family protein [Rhodospirillaceae bacterium]MBT6242085.1 GcvT family protein [Rhodospirillaceae bacterium]MBT7137260.1 GcvT family protein [Rhodospirillaceae bacterium]